MHTYIYIHIYKYNIYTQKHTHAHIGAHVHPLLRPLSASHNVRYVFIYTHVSEETHIYIKTPIKRTY